MKPKTEIEAFPPDNDHFRKDNQDNEENEKDDNKLEETERVKFWRPSSVRMQIGVLMCLNFFVLCVMRNNMGVAMVCMVNKTAVKEAEMAAKGNGSGNFSLSTNEQESKEDARSRGCLVPEHFNDEYQGEFFWSSQEQGMLFAAIYWGSFSTLIAGWLSDRYSPKLVLLASGVLNVLSTALQPIAARRGGFPVMFFMRCFAGVGQGLQRPSTNALLARWVPIDERSTVVSLYTTGNQLSSIVSTPLFAWLCQLRQAWGGWPLIFFVSAGMGVIWCFMWCLLATDDPAKCRRIGQKELKYISSKLPSQTSAKRRENAKSIPWRKLLTSMPVMACIVCSVANGMVLSLSGSYVPTYFKDVLYMDLQSNGLFAALPFIVQWAMKFVFAALSDNLLRAKKLKATMMSKMFNTIASFGTGGFLFACSCLTCDQKPWAITFLCLSLGFFGVFASGYWTSMVNICPRYAGTVCALATTALTIGAITAPYLVGAMVVDGTREEWQWVFGTIAACLAVSGTFYIIFGSADLQSWAKDDTASSSNVNENDNAHRWQSQEHLVHSKAVHYLGLPTFEEKTLAHLVQP